MVLQFVAGISRQDLRVQSRHSCLRVLESIAPLVPPLELW